MMTEFATIEEARAAQKSQSVFNPGLDERIWAVKKLIQPSGLNIMTTRYFVATNETMFSLLVGPKEDSILGYHEIISGPCHFFADCKAFSEEDLLWSMEMFNDILKSVIDHKQVYSAGISMLKSKTRNGLFIGHIRWEFLSNVSESVLLKTPSDGKKLFDAVMAKFDPVSRERWAKNNPSVTYLPYFDPSIYQEDGTFRLPSINGLLPANGKLDYETFLDNLVCYFPKHAKVVALDLSS